MGRPEPGPKALCNVSGWPNLVGTSLPGVTNDIVPVSYANDIGGRYAPSTL
jgi:hypothetical protein